jgi:peptidoglycan/xylan/chitin deacetylase (PgdA/CDA1 family)
MLKEIKRPILRTLKGLGVHREWNDSEWRRERLAILCYHGVSIDDEHLWNPELYVTADWLDSRLKFLRDAEFNVLSLDEGVRRLYTGTLPPRSVVLTFDDGGFDFYARAVPVLKKYGYPVTVYLTTYYCFHPRPIFPLVCYYLLWKARNSFTSDAFRDWDCPSGLDFHSQNNLAVVVSSIVSYSQKSPHDSIVEEVARRLNLDYQEFHRRRLFQLMNPAEVAQLSSFGVDVQLHTHRHRVPMDHGLFDREIVENRQLIREITGKEAVHFCYPSGEYEEAFLPWLRALRVESATTCDNGLASRADSPLLLPRIVDHQGLNEIELESSLIGIGTGLFRTHEVIG